MERHILGNGLEASAVGLGCMGFSHAYGALTDKDEAVKLILGAAQISMAWMLCKKSWIVPIPSTRKPDRMKENIGAADIKLSAEDIRVLDDALGKMEMSEVFGGSKLKTGGSKNE